MQKPYESVVASIERNATMLEHCFADDPSPPRLIVKIRLAPTGHPASVSVSPDVNPRIGGRPVVLPSRARVCAERALARLSFAPAAADGANTAVVSLDFSDRVAPSPQRQGTSR